MSRRISVIGQDEHIKDKPTEQKVGITSIKYWIEDHQRENSSLIMMNISKIDLPGNCQGGYPSSVKMNISRINQLNKKQELHLSNAGQKTNQREYLSPVKMNISMIDSETRKQELHLSVIGQNTIKEKIYHRLK